MIPRRGAGVAEQG